MDGRQRARYYPTTACGSRTASRRYSVARARPKQRCDLVHRQVPRLPQSTRRASFSVDITARRPLPDPSAPLLKIPDRLDQMPQRSTQPIQPPHHQRVPRTHMVQARIKLRTMLDRSRPILAAKMPACLSAGAARVDDVTQRHRLVNSTPESLE